MKLKFSEKLTYYSLYFLSILISFIPRIITIKIGIIIGNFIRICIPIRKKVAILNIDIAFPEKTIQEKKIILKKCYHHYGIILMDIFRIGRLDKKKLNQFTKFPIKDIKKLQNSKGGIIVSGHVGNWELFLILFGLNNIDLHAVVQYQRNKGVQYYFNEVREKHGSKIILKGISSKELINIIKDKKFLGLISDQNAGVKGVSVPFFGKKTSIPKGAAIFQMKTNCPIFFCYCIADNNYNYSMIINKIDLNYSGNGSDDEIAEICKLISNDLEKIVEKYPEQYFWFHRKWLKNIYIK